MKKLALGALIVGLTACGGGGKNNDILLPDGSTVDAITVCSPLTQMGCGAGEKCAWIEDQEMPPIGHIGCAPDGTVAVGGACTVGAAGPAGYSNCAKNSECVAGTCKAICDHQGGMPSCDANHACGRYEGLFTSGDMTVAGVCDPKCDPLTQNLLAGTNTAACGSPDPAMPNAGCFTFDGLDYTCAPVGPTTLTLTDRMPARGPASGGAYVNGCAPGFLPFFREATGVNVTVCAGMCAPLKTDNSAALKLNVVGSKTVPAKLPTKAEPAAGDAVCVTNKKGSVAEDVGTWAIAQNCLYMWPFNIENGMLPASPYNDGLGICFDFRKYTYDDDNNAGTPARNVPSCAALPPQGTVANCTCDAMGNNCTGTGCPDGQAHEWGCYPTPAAFSSKAQAPAIKPAMREFRVGATGAGEGVRHMIR
ncbi:MAG: hypothetical protein M3680_17425 [Myxococcota bacterium]|nr:hypothetical protein [Myxococcota bacterium]